MLSGLAGSFIYRSQSAATKVNADSVLIKGFDYICYEKSGTVSDIITGSDSA
jgi:hypothetical protein